MNEFSTYEFAVAQRIEGKWRAARVGLILLYIAYAAGLLLIGIRTTIFVPVLALIPITLWILIFFTWRYTDVDYEYSITSGELTFAKIFGNRSRRVVLKLHLRDAVRIAPLDDAQHSAYASNWHPERTYSAVSCQSAPDAYYILFEQKGKTRKENARAIFYFEATQKALQVCRFYNPSATVLTKTTR